MNKLHLATPLTAALLAACSPGTGTPAAATVTLTGPATLKLSAPVQLTATAKDASGNAIAGKTFAWTSSDPNVVGVDGSGNLTAKRLSVNPVTLVASADDQSATLKVTTYGLELTMGTYNRDPGQSYAKVGTAFLFKFRKANGQGADADAPVSLSGPSGFDASNIIYAKVYASDEPSSSWTYSGNQPPVAGPYSASATVDGEHYSSSTSLDHSALLPGFTSATLDITARTATTTFFTFGGSPDPQIKAFQPALYNDSDFFGLYTWKLGGLPFSDKADVPVKDGTYTKAVYAFSTTPWDFGGVTPNQFNMSKVNIGTVTLP